MRYHHTQYAPLYLILVAVGVVMLVAAWVTPDRPVQVILIISGVLMLILAASFRQLTVRDDGDSLLIQFEPLPLFRSRVAYAEIDKVQQGRTSILDSWGIHLSPSGGWTWNLWGFDCVDVFLSRRRKVRIGTDDPKGLEDFLLHQVDHRPETKRAE
jgi:hypothetical protein